EDDAVVAVHPICRSLRLRDELEGISHGQGEGRRHTPVFCQKTRSQASTSRAGSKRSNSRASRKTPPAASARIGRAARAGAIRREPRPKGLKAKKIRGPARSAP